MNKQIELRSASEKDLEDILEIYNDVVINTTAIYQNTSRSLPEQREWFLLRKKQGFPVIVAELNGQVAGYGSFGPFRNGECYSSTVEHSLHVASNFRGKGIGSELLVELMDLAQKSGAHAMIAGIDSTNLVSLRLHNRHGFKQVGTLPQVARKFSRWLDLTLLQTSLNNNELSATEGKPVSERYFSGAPWEQEVSYCRAVKRGNSIAISGTVSMKDGKVFGIGDPYLQAKQCLDIMEGSLKSFAVDRFSIIRTRIFVKSIQDWPAIAKAHKEFFRDCPPATSMIQISALIEPEFLLEIEADAVVSE